MEAGFKGRLMDDRLALSATIFRMQRRDVQIATSITRLRNDGSAEFIGYTGNGAEGVNQGVEFEAVLQAADRLQLTASVGCWMPNLRITLTDQGRLGRSGSGPGAWISVLFGCGLSLLSSAGVEYQYRRQGRLLFFRRSCGTVPELCPSW